MMYPDEDELRKAVEQFEGYFVNVDQTVDQPIYTKSKMVSKYRLAGRFYPIVCKAHKVLIVVFHIRLIYIVNDDPVKVRCRWLRRCGVFISDRFWVIYYGRFCDRNSRHTGVPQGYYLIFRKRFA